MSQPTRPQSESVISSAINNEHTYIQQINIRLNDMCKIAKNAFKRNMYLNLDTQPIKFESKLVSISCYGKLGTCYAAVGTLP
jgi:hypothetical protein